MTIHYQVNILEVSCNVCTGWWLVINASTHSKVFSSFYRLGIATNYLVGRKGSIDFLVNKIQTGNWDFRGPVCKSLRDWSKRVFRKYPLRSRSPRMVKCKTHPLFRLLYVIITSPYEVGFAMLKKNVSDTVRCLRIDVLILDFQGNYLFKTKLICNSIWTLIGRWGFVSVFQVYMNFSLFVSHHSNYVSLSSGRCRHDTNALHIVCF